MPKVVITFDPDHHDYLVEPVREGIQYDPEYQVVMDMKSSHYLNIKRNRKRFENDLDALRKFFVEGQTRGRNFREQ